MKKWLLALSLLTAPVASSYAGEPLFTPDELPHNISYPAFLQEELFFIPEPSGKDTIKTMMDLNDHQILIFTPAIHTQHIGDFYQIDTSLMGHNTAFYENVFSLHVDFNLKTQFETSKFHIDSGIRRFDFKDGKVIDIPPFLDRAGSYYSEDANSFKDVQSDYHYNIISRHHNDNGFDTVTIEKKKVSYKGHFELFINTGYSSGLKGEYVLHVSFDAPSMQNRPQ